jgi:IclR family acetate operon transcriptional repressor
VKQAVKTERYSLAGIDRAVSVLEAFTGDPPLTPVEVARRSRLNETTAFRYLASLVAHGLVERGDDGRYRLGLRLFQFGQRALAGRDPRLIALPYMERLLKRFDETVNLAVRNRNELILIEVLESTRSIKKGAALGDRDHWHASSLGKSILAWLPAEEARALLAQEPLSACTPETLTSVDELLDDLESVRERGYAIDDEESELDLRCLGAAILDVRGRPSYAISISGPANRFTSELSEAMAQDVKVAADAISKRLGYLPLPIGERV